MILQAVPQPAPPSAESISFRLERPNSPLPSFTLTIHADGSALYQVAYPPEVPRYSPYAASMAAQPPTQVSMDVALTPATAANLFDRVRSTSGFAKPCASKAKNIASTGKKTLTYVAAGVPASCTYDYTEDKTIASLTSSFEGIAFTLDEGRKLEREHRYDRLALDHETEFLSEQFRQGNAVELAVIAPILRSLVDDAQLLERVRTRAANLLAQSVPDRTRN